MLNGDGSIGVGKCVYKQDFWTLTRIIVLVS